MIIHPFLNYDRKFKTNYFEKYIIGGFQYGSGKKYIEDGFEFHSPPNGQGFIIEERENYVGVSIFIGDIDRGEPSCVDIQIFNDLPTIANLVHYQYDIKYCINKELEPKKGTRLMIKIIINYLKENFPEVKYIELMDISKYNCQKDNIKLEIFKLYFFIYGKGYYQKNFGFELYRKQDIIEYKNNLLRLKVIRVNKDWVEKVLLELKFPLKKIEEFLDEIGDNELWRNVFLKLRINKKLNDYCLIIDKLLNRIMNENGIVNLFGYSYRLKIR
jgi:hypothetical protein